MYDNKVYVISGKNLQKIINLLQDLKEVAAEYADMVGEDVDDVYDTYEKLIKDILSSDLFEDIEYDDLFGQYSLDKISHNFHLWYISQISKGYSL